jgi:hypothetical protein
LRAGPVANAAIDVTCGVVSWSELETLFAGANDANQLTP